MERDARIFFEELSKDRSESANMLEKPSMRGIKNSVVEKYSDQAHFIYELLQNADDAKATSARFVLEHDRLIFAHNGSRHFSVSDPRHEDEDSQNGCLGDINAITSIANSNKTEASIGKFGVGFKAVFQYTSTPHVYGPVFRFRIDRFIVPSLLHDDYPGRKPEETLFVFPFDHPDRDAKTSYADIADKLKSLSFPLLFLTGLKDISFDFDSNIGLYGKSIKETLRFDETTAERICLTQNDGDVLFDENLWMFSRLDEKKRRYSVGFFLDSEQQLRAVNEPAFCFFPTKEVTNLSFLIHGPFLLTDSREGIRAGVEHNDNLIRRIALLAADALVFLRDMHTGSTQTLITDNVISLIPYDPEKFSSPDDKRKVSFLPFYTSIKEKMASEALLPATSGHVCTNNAYWASVPQLPKLFSDEQLGEICSNDKAKWVFPSLGRDEVQRNNRALFNYIDSLVRTNLSEDVVINGRSKGFYYWQKVEVIRGISEEFIEHQSMVWLHEFYKWISETKGRTDLIKKKPIFKDQNGNAAAAFDKSGELILFLPVDNAPGYRVVHPDILKVEETRRFVEEIGIKKPSLKNQIYNIILPLYSNGHPDNTDAHFAMFFEYYCKCSNQEVRSYIDLIKTCEFLAYRTCANPCDGYSKPGELYLPTSELHTFFEPIVDAKFVDLLKYQTLVGEASEKSLIPFLTDLGVRVVPRIIEKTEGGYTTKTQECFIEGLMEFVNSVSIEQNPKKSRLLWQLLCEFSENGLLHRIADKKISTRPDGRYKWRNSYVESSTATLLRSSPWLIGPNGCFVNASSHSSCSISEHYMMDHDSVDDLLAFLGIEDQAVESVTSNEDDSNLTASQRETMAFALRLQSLGIEEEDLEALLEIKKQRKETAAQREVAQNQPNTTKHNESSQGTSVVIDFDDHPTADNTPESKHRTRKNEVKVNVVKDIIERAKDGSASSLTTHNHDTEVDNDELIPTVVDYSKRLERAKQKSAAEIERIAQFEEIQSRILAAQKYSFGWFNALLEMESLNSTESNSNSKEISISFSAVEREPGTTRTLVLKYPNRYIPQFMEDLADIPLVLHIGDEQKTLAIEVANIKSYTLRVKLKNNVDISNIDFSAITSATIDAKSPAFLLDELRKQFSQMEYEDEFDMQANLCKNIEFVFGPPGTGKTTHLANNVLLPLMEKFNECKVLVLTPTNKAADVLVRRIFEVCGSDHSYEKWLVRFGATADEDIERSAVYRDKTFDIRTLAKNITITTIARFPYDFFMPEGTRIFLNGINWDYIVIDEASMIPLANIVYPLYKKTPNKFIIAGDPFQIQPITSVNMWKDENIYSMVQLNSFVSPKTVPHQYKVELLTTQYRCVPKIGQIFSEFAYGGILKHHRSSESQKALNLGLGIKTLNILKFPVSKYESIYRSKRLQHGSPYQVYSALFTFEYISFLSKQLAINNPQSHFRIGVIAPYRAQADMIDKLLASEILPREVDVQVDTIHGFQGDECDIVFAVFNSPPTISASNEMFLNKQNIINVSISRARDYLFIVMPDDQTENIANLRLIKQVESLIKKAGAYQETHTPTLEQMMFGDQRYLENNAFSTSHQSVNVYGLPEKRYEIRTEDNAIDVQIHRSVARVMNTEESLHLVDKSVMVEENNPSTIAINATAQLDMQENFSTSEITGTLARDESAIPKGLKKNATEVTIVGAYSGEYYLVHYNGKLKKYTDRKTVAMFIPLIVNKKEKLISVSVNLEDRLIFIERGNYKLYEKWLGGYSSLKLRASNM